MRYLSPFSTRPLTSRVFTDLDDVFEDFFANTNAKLTFTPAADIEEHENHFLVSFDLPGMKLEDIKIELKDNTLQVSGERKQEYKSDKDDHFKRYERQYGSFFRSFTLPTTVNKKDIEANYENGVMHILIPKKGEETKSTIEIKSGEKEGFLSKLAKKL